MRAAWTLVELAGYVALLLWGVRMVQTAFERALGNELRRMLQAALGSRFSAFAAGLVATAVLQSSTATGLMIASFAGAGMVDLVPALAAMLGANVGTTLIVQFLTFDVMTVVPALFLLGVFLYRHYPDGRRHDLGRVPIGLGLILTALTMLVETIEPLVHTTGFGDALGVLGAWPVLAFVAATVATWAAHSSVAVVLLVGSIVTAQAVPVEAALAMVLGANLGTAINPCLEAHVRDPAGRRVPIGNLVSRLVACLAVLPLLPLLTPLLGDLEIDADRRIADFHTAFNLAAAVVFLPLLPPIARLLERLLPARPLPLDPDAPVHLDRALLSVSDLAIGAAERETARVAEATNALFALLPQAIEGDGGAAAAEIHGLAQRIDTLGTAVRDYLADVEVQDLAAPDRAREIALLVFTINVAHAAEIVDHGVVEHLRRRADRGGIHGAPLVADTARQLAAAVEVATEPFRRGAIEEAGPDHPGMARLTAISAAALEALAGAGSDPGSASPESLTTLLDVLRDLHFAADMLAAAIGDEAIAG